MDFPDVDWRARDTAPANRRGDVDDVSRQERVDSEVDSTTHTHMCSAHQMSQWVDSEVNSHQLHLCAMIIRVLKLVQAAVRAPVAVLDNETVAHHIAKWIFLTFCSGYF